MASLDILCSNPLNLKNKITYRTKKDILWPIKNIEKYFMVYQYMLKIFHGTYKNPPPLPPTYLMNSP